MSVDKQIVAQASSSFKGWESIIEFAHYLWSCSSVESEGLAQHVAHCVTLIWALVWLGPALRGRIAWMVDQTAMTHCYSKLHQSCPHSHRSRHRNDRLPHIAGCSRAQNPFGSPCWLKTVKFRNILEKNQMLKVKKMVYFNIQLECDCKVLWKVSYHSIASFHLIYPCSGLFHHRLAGNLCTRHCHTQIQCGCYRRSFLLQKMTVTLNT